MNGVLLLGWMKRDVAVAALRERCLFSQPLSQEAASDLWARHRWQTEELPPRPRRQAEALPLSPPEEVVVANFLEEQARVGGKVTSVVKLNSRQLAVHQLAVALDRSDQFGRLCRTRAQWIEQWLNPPPTAIEGRVRATINAVSVELPHPEFVLSFDSDRGFQVVEAPRFVTVTLEPRGPILVAGHHRVHGYLSSPLAESDSSILAVPVSPSDGDADSPSAVAEGAADVCARCPPMMSDFFDDRLALRVKIRPRRFELQVRARMAAVPA